MNAQDFSLSVSFVAQRLNTTELNVLMHIKRGLLSGLEMGGEWFVSEASFNNFLTTDKKSVPPVICKTGHCGHGCGSC